MRVRIVAASSLDGTDARSWRELAERAIEPNVYLDPRWLLTSTRIHPDAAALRLAIVEDDLGMHGVLAFDQVPVWRGLPFQALSTGGDFMQTHAERHHPLVDDHAPAAVLSSLITALSGAGTPGMVELRKFPGDGPLYDALKATISAHQYPYEERVRRSWAFANPLGASGGQKPGVTDFTIPRASGRRQKRTNQYVRGLERALDAELKLIERSADEQALTDFLSLQFAGWKGDESSGGLAMGRSEVTRNWFTTLTAAFAADGDLHVLELRAGEQLVYSTISLSSGGMTFGFLDSYDARFARFGPGTLGRVAEMNFLRRRRPDHAFDPNLDPYYASSSDLYPDRRDRIDVLLAPGGIWPRAAFRLMPWGRRIRNAKVAIWDSARTPRPRTAPW